MPNELIVFPDPVAVLSSALAARLPELGVTGVPVVGENINAARFVKLIRTGGFDSSLVVDRAMVTIEAFDATTQASAALASAVRAVINASEGAVVDGVQLYRVVEFSGPANSPDPASGSPRHTWTVEVGVRGAAA